MKVFTQFLIKISVMVTAVLLTTTSYGAVFTATASGDFSSSATWSGGIIPPTTLTSDVIVIPAGITVTLDQNLTVNGTLAQLDVAGSLITNESSSLVMVEGTLSGTGTISLNTIDLKAGTTFLFTGAMYVKDLNVDATFATTADMAIDKTLSLQSGDMSLTTGGSLTLSPEARLMFSGGSLTVGTGGYADLSTDYSVRYGGNSFTTGVELTGTGLKDIEVDMNPGSTLTLTSDVTVAGKLELNSGTLSLADRDLIINGDVTSTTGTILSTSQSDITINALSSTTGALSFETGSELKDLIINMPAEYAAKIEGYLSLYGDLALDSGILKMGEATVNIYGDVTGTGMLSTTPLTDLSIVTSSELSTSLRFDTSGQVLNSLTVAVGADNELTLDSDLTVKGELALTDGSILKLNSTSLTLDSESSITGTGKLSVDGYSALTINSAAGLDALKMDGTIGDLTINTDASSTVNLTSDARVSGMLTLQSGTMMLNDYDLTVMGDVSTSGEGKIYTTTSSDVTFSSGTSGSLTFGDGSIVKTMTVDAGTDFTAKISGDVTIDSLLKLTSGVMFMDDASVTLKGDIVGTGMFSSTDADMTISSTTTLSEPLRFTADANTLNSLTVAVGENNKVSLGSDLTVDGMLSLTDGSALDISGRTLVLDSESNLTGTGFIKVDSTSSLMINATTDIASLKMDGTIGDLTINSVDGSVTLNSDARVDGTLTMASGEMILNKYDLTIYGNISTAGTGTLSTTAESDIKIETQTAPAGSLRFSANANTVGDMTVKIADSGFATVDSDMTIDKNLYLQSGILDMNDQTLFMSTTSTVVGGSSTSYVKTDAGGYIERDITECDSFMYYPTGTFTSYAPTYISLKCGSEMGKVSVGLASDVYAQGSTGTDLSLTESMVDATWDINSTISSGLDMDLRVLWPSTIEVNNFDRTDAFISHYTNGTWDSSPRFSSTPESNGMYSLDRTSITSLSPFAVFDVNTITATDDVTGDILLKVFPNPAVDNLIIQSISTVDPLNMDIYNSTGQLMGQYKLTEPNSTVSVKDLMNGNYFLRFYNKDLVSTMQFTKI